MKCIYRKEIKYKAWSTANQRYGYAPKDTATYISVEFVDCHGAECPMYSDGKCLRALKEINAPTN